MIGRISKARHVVVLASIATTTLLAALGVIGDDHPERFDTWQVVYEPIGADGLRVTETFDQDFGSNDRHGPQRTIPNDFGVPTDVVADSPDAPVDVSVTHEGSDTVVRIGDPDVEVSGQHRYTLSYTLPEANLSSGFLAVDALGGDEFETTFAEVVVRGLELVGERCFVGESGATTECDLDDDDEVYRATFEPLPAHTGISVEGTITGRRDLVEVAEPPLPDRRRTSRLPVTLAVAVLGLVGASGVYVWARRRGRNAVFAGGAADAAFGEMPPPGAAGGLPGTRLVADADMADLATTEFVPPAGLAPWQGRVVLVERVDDRLVEAWVSGLAARDAIEISENGSKLVIASGPKRGELDPHDAMLLAGILDIDDPYETGSYDPAFAQAWSAIRASLAERVDASGWWMRMPPGRTSSRAKAPFVLFVVIAIAMIWFGSLATALFGVFQSLPLALLLGVGLPAVVAYAAYGVLLPARSAVGSALALQAESFRRFLDASEGQHVEWAWSKGLLREYSAWAVALDEADAWSDALSRANVPEPARAMAAAPIIVHHQSTSMSSSRTAPSSSSSGGSSGGTSGGSVGGGGGGGSRGSW